MMNFVKLSDCIILQLFLQNKRVNLTNLVVLPQNYIRNYSQMSIIRTPILHECKILKCTFVFSLSA